MSQGPRPWALALSIFLHAVLLGVLWWAALETVKPVPPVATTPLALELIAGGAAPQATPEPTQAAPQPQVEQAPAEVNIGSKPEKPQPPKPEPTPPREPIRLKEPPKPEPKLKEPPKPAPTKQKPFARADDLLADLGPPSAKPGKDRLTQAGAKSGVEGGSSKGAGSVSGYDTRVRAKIRPLVRIPDDISGNPTAVVRVTLLPSLEVNRVALVKSSGNSAYDTAVLNAVREAGTFPPLLPGLTFDEVRNMTLRFRPQD